MKQNLDDFQWIRPPKKYAIQKDGICVTTEPHTDLWQRTYYHFRNDNAPVFQMETDEQFSLLYCQNRFFRECASIRSMRNCHVSEFRKLAEGFR